MTDPTLTRPFASYPHVREAAGLVFIAGQGCRDPVSNAYSGLTLGHLGDVQSYDVRAQTRGVFANVERALASCGLRRQDLVDVTVFLCDMKDFDAMNEVWNEFFANAPAPTRTTVAVRALPGHNFVEMKAVAARRQET